MFVGLFLAATSLLGQQDNKAFVRIAPDKVPWIADADGSGVERATLAGDPAKEGLYVIRIKFPRGTMSRPHYHREDRYAVVLKGTWWTGTGGDFVPDKTVPVPVGGFMKHPAGEHHFDGAKDEEVILQIVGYGPSTTTRLRPQDGNYGPSLGK
jgi:hypothetical protein